MMFVVVCKEQRCSFGARKERNCAGPKTIKQKLFCFEPWLPTTANNEHSGHTTSKPKNRFKK